MRTKRVFEAAFSLIEITVALGLLCFCLTALLGLFCVGLKSSQGAGNDTALALMASGVASKLASQTNFPFGQEIYFDHDGGSVTNVSQAYYACRISTNAVAASQLAGVSTNLSVAAMTFTWPHPRAVQTQIFYATFLR